MNKNDKKYFWRNWTGHVFIASLFNRVDGNKDGDGMFGVKERRLESSLKFI